MSEKKLQPVLFVGGTGRCGTRIFKKVLSLHPDVGYLPEWHAPVAPGGIYDFYRRMTSTWTPFLAHECLRQLEKVLQDVARQGKLQRAFKSFVDRRQLQQKFGRKLIDRYATINMIGCCPDYELHVKRLLQQLTAFEFDGSWIGAHSLEKRTLRFHAVYEEKALIPCLHKFLLAVYGDVAKLQQASRVVDDNVQNLLWAKTILEIFPEAKFVHVFRDPRDVVASLTHQIWAPADYQQAIDFYIGIMDRWAWIRQQIDRQCYTEISLETMVAEPERVLQRICRFWDIPWNPLMLKVDLGHAHSGRWQKDFTSQQQRVLVRRLEPYICQYGYC